MPEIREPLPSNGSAHCDGSCSACGDRPAAPDLSLQGWRMVAASAGIFLLPLGCAAMGAMWAGSTPLRQALGAFGGGLAGVGLARIGYLFARRADGDPRPDRGACDLASRTGGSGEERGLPFPPPPQGAARAADRAGIHEQVPRRAPEGCR